MESEKHADGVEKPNTEDPPAVGFEIRLPYGLGWLRGGEKQLNILLPTVRWILIVASLVYLTGKVVSIFNE